MYISLIVLICYYHQDTLIGGWKWNYFGNLHHLKRSVRPYIWRNRVNTRTRFGVVRRGRRRLAVNAITGARAIVRGPGRQPLMTERERERESHVVRIPALRSLSPETGSRRRYSGFVLLPWTRTVSAMGSRARHFPSRSRISPLAPLILPHPLARSSLARAAGSFAPFRNHRRRIDGILSRTGRSRCSHRSGQRERKISEGYK